MSADAALAELVDSLNAIASLPDVEQPEQLDAIAGAEGFFVTDVRDGQFSYQGAMAVDPGTALMFVDAELHVAQSAINNRPDFHRALLEIVETVRAQLETDTANRVFNSVVRLENFSVHAGDDTEPYGLVFFTFAVSAFQ